jgi:hypothetical protein
LLSIRHSKTYEMLLLHPLALTHNSCRCVSKDGDTLPSRHVSSCDVNACSWDVRGDLTLNSMAQIHTSVTLLTSRDLAWRSGRLTCQHAYQISAVTHISWDVTYVSCALQALPVVSRNGRNAYWNVWLRFTLLSLCLRHVISRGALVGSRASTPLNFLLTHTFREKWRTCRALFRRYQLFPEMEEMLIEKLRQRTILCDTKSPYYRDQHMRAKAWEGIGKETEIKRRFYIKSRDVRIVCPRLNPLNAEIIPSPIR